MFRRRDGVGGPKPAAASSGSERNHDRLSVGLARSAADVEAAQRLRYQVFAQQMGARIHRIKPGLDVDAYDSWCDHLIVRDTATQQVVGTYRILPPHRVRKVGQLYAESAFDLSRFQHLRASMIEVGRACVHPDYRSGGALLLLWAALAAYMKKGGYRHLVGCASVSIKDGGHHAARLRLELQRYLTLIRQLNARQSGYAGLAGKAQTAVDTGGIAR
nr:GNAT family N-acetyltransferase [Burkholderiaceae bacterium]